MSWDQDYNVPSVEDLFEQLTGKTASQLLHAELERQGIFVRDLKDIVLDEGFETIIGTKVTLTDGRVFVPKLVERFSENGNHGIDSYQYFTEDVTPNISYTGSDFSAEGIDETAVAEFEIEEEYVENDGCGCGD